MRTLSLLSCGLAAWGLTHQAARADVITDWNATAIAYLGQHAIELESSRGLTMVHVAQFDAVNAAVGGFTPYALNVVARGASAEAAAAQAAYTVLTNASRADLSTLNAALTRSLASVPAGQAREDGIALGRLAAQTIIRLRAADNVNLPITPPTSTAVGKWRTTPPNFEAGAGAQYRYILPWTLGSQAQLRPGPPPPLTSEQYALDLNEVRRMGALRSTNRTTSQTAAAQFHFAGEQAFLKPALAQRSLPLVESARLHALLYMIIMDEEIAFFEAQYHYNFWRPITAIRNAANDGNDQTEPDATWTPLLDTPNHPEYPSGTCTFTSAMATLLIDFFGDEFSFRATSRKGPTRDFERLSAIVNDAVEARIAAGVHFRNSCVVGVDLGRNVARHALAHFLRPVPELAGALAKPGEFALHLSPGRGASMVIESSADLREWTPRQTNSWGILLHDDTGAGAAGRRFYRALLQP